MTSLLDDNDSDADISQVAMSPPSSSPAALVPSERLRLLLARERSRRRAAEDWATFLVATLDAYVRASHAYDRQLADSACLKSGGAFKASRTQLDGQYAGARAPLKTRKIATVTTVQNRNAAMCFCRFPPAFLPRLPVPRVELVRDNDNQK